MPRANRYYLPGYVWHITHPCHKREFLLKFGRDRRRWLQWLCEAKKRFGVSILNYTVACNHIHLLIRDDQGEEVILQTMQLIAGRTGQEYNRRKIRKGAFWVMEALEKQGWRKRQAQWTELIAVGRESFVRETKERLGAKPCGGKW